MKHPSPRNDQSRFSGSLRHYHRTAGQTQRTWDEWVDGKPKSRFATNWLKVVLVSLAVVALIGILAALFIEMR